MFGLLQSIKRRQMVLSQNGVVKVAKFDLSDWQEVKSCGTTACACGYAGTTPWFTKRGFTIDVDSDGDGHPIYKNSSGKVFEGWEAVTEFFGLTSREAYYLFMSDAYSERDRKSPGAVADRINAFLIDRQRADYSKSAAEDLAKRIERQLDKAGL